MNYKKDGNTRGNFGRETLRKTLTHLSLNFIGFFYYNYIYYPPCRIIVDHYIRVITRLNIKSEFELNEVL